jgi:hypothetical protein
MIKLRRMRWVRHVAQMGGKDKLIYAIGENARRKEHRWVDNIKMDLGERVEWTGLVWLKIGTSGGLLRMQ